MLQVAYGDLRSRVKEKQVSRAKDAARLQSKSIGRAELREANGFFSALPLNRYKIVAIGGKAYPSK